MLPRHLIHIDVVSADIDKDYRPQLELTGSIAATLHALAAQLNRRTFPAENKLLSEIARDRTKFAEQAAALNGVSIHPMRLVHGSCS
jgi:acetolactate synthase-1/2/3 large subunit